mgnify:FL=1
MKKIIVVFLFMLLMCGCKENKPPIDDPIQIDEAKVSEVYDSLDIIYEDIATIKMSDEATRNEIIRIRTLYDALNDQEKAKITNYKKLEELEILLKAYQDEQDAKAEEQAKRQQAVDDVYNQLDETIAKYYEDDFELKTIFKFDDNIDVYVSWTTSDPATISNTGKVTRPRVNNVGVTLTANIRSANISRQFSRSIKIPFLPYEKLPQTPVFGYFYQNQSKLKDIESKTIDIINLSFADITNDGNISVLGLNYSTVLDERKNGTRVLFSVQDKQGFKKFTASSTGRTKLVKSFVNAVKEYHFDGVDIDWEYPEGSTEVANYTIFMQLLYTELKKISRDYLVTTAVYGGNGHSHYNVKVTQNYVDYMHLMTYDLNALDTTSHLTSLSGGTSVISTVNAYYNAGVPKSKLVIGAAFYGKIYKLPDTATKFLGVRCGEGATTITYRSIKATYLSKLDTSDNIVREWDSVAQAPYLCITDANGSKYFITYDDVESVKLKAQYVLDNQLGGMMFWELGEEDRTTNDLVGAINSVIKK